MTTASASATSYDQLVARMREIGLLQSTQRTLSWDQETMMPRAGAGLRARQLEQLASMVHARFTDPRVGELIGACEEDGSLLEDEIAAANVRELRRDYDKQTRLPGDLVAEIARTSSQALQAWKEARAQSDFGKFLPWLEKTFSLSRRKAECLGVPEWGGELYDALMDEYEPEMTAARTAEIFTPLRAFTVELLEKVRSAPGKPDPSGVVIDFPIERQKEFSRRVLERMGFDFGAGRMDEAVHPFCEGPGPGDTRLTNRYRPDGWLDQLSSATHEGGHGIYEQGVAKEAHFGLPMGEAVSLGIHESQSRMWENQIARSLPFWEWAIGVAREVLGEKLRGVDAGTVYRVANVVEPHFIRVESDEVTYNLHIMLRFDLERAMIAGDLLPKDLPGVWNERMRKDLGLTVKEDRLGCLQDIHWSMGAVGYFATYSLGNIYAAQLWEAMGRAIPDREAQISRGEFGGILGWLRERVHEHGRRYAPEDLCERATGSRLSSDALMRHLESKVESVYGV